MSDINRLIKYHEFLLNQDRLFNKNSFEHIAQSFIDLESEKPIEEEPILIGYLNTAQGFKGFKLSDVGTEVFSYKDKYFINIEPLNGGLTMRISYYKETLKPIIDFI